MALPFLKWAGGKRQMLPELRKHVPASFGAYYEPFVGAGALFFDLEASGRLKDVAHLNDANRALMRSYAGVRHAPIVIGLLKEMKYDRAEYYERREVDPLRESLTHEQAAAWVIYMNRCCFNGLWRVNKAGKFNVPFGAYSNPTICDAAGLLACQQALVGGDGTIMQYGSFEIPMASAKKSDFVYCDPPYVPLKVTSFTAYEKSGFGTAEHTLLRDCAAAARDRGVHVVLSNSDCALVRELYKDGFELYEVQGRRNVNSKGDGRGKVSELIIVGKI